MELTIQVRERGVVPLPAELREKYNIESGKIFHLVDLDGRRWLFPGDTRTYDPAGLPDHGPVDVLFAHLWLGRGAALQTHPPLLEQFCRFCLALQPQRLILTHLQEWGRQASEFWNLEPVELVVSVFKEHAPLLPIEIACTGDVILLEGNA